VEEGDWRTEVLSALAQSCGLCVRRAGLHEGSSLAGFIDLGAFTGQPEAPDLRKHPSIRIIPSAVVKSAATIRFTTGALSPLPFRGRSAVSGCAIPSWPRTDVSEEILATADGNPVWTTASVDGLRHDTCWVTDTWIQHGECVFHHLNSSRFMNLLPVLEWMRSVSDYHQWQQPSLRACFMFDDPNLHRRRYGFVDYAQLAAEGRRHHYHSSFATVPLDGYYVNRAAARIILENRETLSFLMHGNNHTYRELAARGHPGRQLALMRQAVLRTWQLERKSGVTVSNVMAPPHGVCSGEMMAAMAGAGLEAVCVSHGSVWTGNPDADWTISLGSLPAVNVAGLPVIPRFGLDRKPENGVLLAAYLGQAIILVGHHWDLADGLDILSSAARFINGLGAVTWCDMATIARNNYRFRIQGAVMHVQTFSRVTTVNVPDGISQLELEVPWLDPTRDSIECRPPGIVSRHPFQVAQPDNLRFSVTPGSRVDFILVRDSGICGVEAAVHPRTPLGAIARRVFTELRDHSMPCLPRRFTR
jgi:hypothetical protein